MENYSLLKILQKDELFKDLLKKKTENVKKDKQSLLNTATLYTQKYSREIEEGTLKRQKLLTEGKEKGLTEEEVFRNNTTFYPTKYTPILNFLFFTFREEANENTVKMQLEELTQYYIEKFGYEGFIKKLEEGSTYTREVYAEDLDDILTDDTNDIPSSDSFIYGTMDHAMFKKIKKLKALSQSPNEKEAFLAYRKCLELCKKYDLEFDKIPCNVRKPS